MHALVKNGSIVKYPYTIGMLRKDNPNTSFPKNPTDEFLSGWSMERITKIGRPDIDHTKNIDEDTPQQVNGVWTQVWKVTDASAEEIAQRIEQNSTSIRAERNTLLIETDWTQVADAPVDQDAWATYRQALRDITAHENFPYLQEEDWPTKP